MSPGVTHLPTASMTRAPGGAAMPRPTAAIRPSASSTSVPSRRASLPVRTVPPRISVGGETAALYVEGYTAFGGSRGAAGAFCAGAPAHAARRAPGNRASMRRFMGEQFPGVRTLPDSRLRACYFFSCILRSCSIHAVQS